MGYARVSSHAQKDDLERWVEMIKTYAKEKGWEIEMLKEWVLDLLKMVINKEVSKVVAYADRLTRFEFKTRSFSRATEQK